MEKVDTVPLIVRHCVCLVWTNSVCEISIRYQYSTILLSSTATALLYCLLNKCSARNDFLLYFESKLISCSLFKFDVRFFFRVSNKKFDGNVIFYYLFGSHVVFIFRDVF
uniref:Uncharacterized protein n=1 Tax=Cacopsylla melanoneura TaxID=428564 RepID=A0A8D8LVV4_9HEMI